LNPGTPRRSSSIARCGARSTLTPKTVPRSSTRIPGASIVKSTSEPAIFALRRPYSKVAAVPDWIRSSAGPSRITSAPSSKAILASPRRSFSSWPRSSLPSWVANPSSQTQSTVSMSAASPRRGGGDWATAGARRDVGAAVNNATAAVASRANPASVTNTKVGIPKNPSLNEPPRTESEDSPGRAASLSGIASSSRGVSGKRSQCAAARGVPGSSEAPTQASSPCSSMYWRKNRREARSATSSLRNLSIWVTASEPSQ